MSYARQSRILSALLAIVASWALAPIASALESAFIAEITEIEIDELGTGLRPGKLLWGFFEAHGCSYGDDWCFDYYGASQDTGGYYYDYSFEATVHVSEYVISAASFGGSEQWGDTWVTNRLPGQGDDRFAVEDIGWGVAEPLQLDPRYPPWPEDIWTFEMRLSLQDIHGGALLNGGVPADNSRFDRFETGLLNLRLVDPTGKEFHAHATITSAVPEPGQTALLASGVAGLAVAARARRRSSRSS